MKFFTDVNKLSQAVSRAARESDLVTFDLFDTLLIRRTADPGQVQEPIADYIADRAALCGIDISRQAVMECRRRTEKRHREQNGAKYPDREAVYPEFMEDMLAEIFGPNLPANILSDVTDFELAVETAMLVPRARLLELLGELRRAGKKIWIMTDIYLPSSHITILLKNTDILPLVDGVTSSADACRAKASGAGFKALQSRLKVEPARWLHVGDNIFADGRRPPVMGIRSFVLWDTAEKRRKLAYRICQTAAHRHIQWRGYLWRRLSRPLEAERNPALPADNLDLVQKRQAEELYYDGYNFFGPLTMAFVRHIAEQAQIRRLKRIYFFSREGRMFLRIWQAAAPFWFKAGGEPETRYLHVSRLALAPAACARRGLPPETAALAFLSPRNRDLRDLCRVFALDPAPLTTFFQKHNLEPDTPLNPIHAGYTPAAAECFQLLLQDTEFQEAVRSQTAERGRLAERYLEQEGFFEHQETAVVDIGWLGTIQRFLYDAIAHRPDCPRLHGFLLAATYGVPYPSTPENDIEGFICDQRQGHSPAGMITNALDIFEEACREPAPGVIGYTSHSNWVEPVRTPDDHPDRRIEMAQDTLYAPLQQGMLDFAARGAPALAVLGYNAADLRPALKRQLVRRMAFPTTAEVRRLRHIHHLDDYEGKHRPSLIFRLMTAGLWDMPLKALRWTPGLRTAFFLRHVFLLPMARRIRKIRLLSA